MQASIKGYFSKSGYTVQAGKPSTSAVSSPAPVKLVSYRTPDSPSRPLKRKAVEDIVTENKNDYELVKRCRRYQPKWRQEFPWLQYDDVNDIMWCGVCREFHSSLKNKGANYGNNVFVVGTNLFKTCAVKDHQSSKIHRDCLENKAAKLNPSDTPLAKANRKMTEEQQQRYNMLFDLAFTIAKHNMSFRDFEVLCRIQIKHNVNIGMNYHNPRSCALFIGSIAAVQRQHAAAAICKSRFIAVMADGSTDRSVAEQESVFIRYVSGGVAVNRFIALVEVENGTASGVLQAIDNALSLVGVDMEEQNSKLVNINLDGASVNMGIYNGVAAQIQNRFGFHVTKVHCINHQLELAILDIRRDNSYLDIFESTIKVSLNIF